MGVLVRPAGRTSWTDQLDRPAGQTSSFYLKPWPVRIFKDFPFSLYIVAASESDEGLFLKKIQCGLHQPFLTFFLGFDKNKGSIFAKELWASWKEKMFKTIIIIGSLVPNSSLVTWFSIIPRVSSIKDHLSSKMISKNQKWERKMRNKKIETKNEKWKTWNKNAAKRSRQHARSPEGRLPPKVVFQWWWSSTEGCLPLKVVFH